MHAIRPMKFDRLQKRLPDSRHAGPVAAVCCALALLAGTVLAHEWLRTLRRDEAATASDLRFRLAAARKLATPASAPTRDFTQSLPASVSVDKLVQTLQDSAQSFNVTLVNVSSEPRVETAQTLPRLEVSIALKGAYPALKSTLAEALDRFPSAVIEQVEIRREAVNAGVGIEDMTIRVGLLLRPSAGERRGP
jgi:hypothetical protein